MERSALLDPVAMGEFGLNLCGGVGWRDGFRPGAVFQDGVTKLPRRATVDGFCHICFLSFVPLPSQATLILARIRSAASFSILSRENTFEQNSIF